MGQKETFTVWIVMVMMFRTSSAPNSKEDDDESVDLDEYVDDPSETGSALDTTGIINSDEGFQDNGELQISIEEISSQK